MVEVMVLFKLDLDLGPAFVEDGELFTVLNSKLSGILAADPDRIQILAMKDKEV